VADVRRGPTLLGGCFNLGEEEDRLECYRDLSSLNYWYLTLCACTAPHLQICSFNGCSFGAISEYLVKHDLFHNSARKDKKDGQPILGIAKAKLAHRST
jgi:hypothetical protein